MSNEMSQVEFSRVAPERGAANDALLFVGLGWVSMLAGIGALSALTSDARAANTAFSVGAAGSLVLISAGFLKYVRAHRAGIKSTALTLACILASLFYFGLYVTFWREATKEYLHLLTGEYPELCLWGGPELVLLSVLSWRVRATRGQPGVRSSLAVVAALSCLVFIWAVILSVDCTCLTLGMAGAPSWPHGASVAVLSTSFIAALFFLVIALRERRAADRPAIARGFWPTSVRFATGLCALLALLSLTPLLFSQLANYWFTAAALILVAAAAGAGSLLARLRQTGPVGWRRRLIFALPVLLISFPLILGAGIAGSAYSAFIAPEREPQADWVWHCPEVIRAPLASRLVRISVGMEAGLYSRSLVSNANLAAEATSNSPKSWRRSSILFQGSAPSWRQKGSGCCDAVWQAWITRDPRSALAAGLSVPTLAQAGLRESTRYDMGAGQAVATLGTDADIRAHLSGQYGYLFVSGMLWALPPERVNALRPDIPSFFRTHPTEMLEWRWFEQMPAEAEATANALIDAPSPALYTSIECALLRQPARIRRALNSNDVVVRKLALRSGVSIEDRALGWRLIDCTRGTLPNTDADEQRAALEILNRFCKTGSWASASISVLPTPPVIAPLTPAETQNIDSVCKRAEERIGQLPAEPPTP